MTEEFKNIAFARYHKGTQGSGLGLSIVYALVVERYGGKVLIKDRVDGEPAKGTRVELWLPKSRMSHS